MIKPKYSSLMNPRDRTVPIHRGVTVPDLKTLRSRIDRERDKRLASVDEDYARKKILKAITGHSEVKSSYLNAKKHTPYLPAEMIDRDGRLYSGSQVSRSMLSNILTSVAHNFELREKLMSAFYNSIIARGGNSILESPMEKYNFYFNAYNLRVFSKKDRDQTRDDQGPNIASKINELLDSINMSNYKVIYQDNEVRFENAPDDNKLSISNNLNSLSDKNSLDQIFDCLYNYKLIQILSLKDNEQIKDDLKLIPEKILNEFLKYFPHVLEGVIEKTSPSNPKDLNKLVNFVNNSARIGELLGFDEA